MIIAHDLTKRYGTTLAVDNLSFEVRPGRVTGFLGPNGAGKSTTMRMVLGLTAPGSGEVTVNGKQYRSLPYPLHEVGALLDARGFHPSRSAYNHLSGLARSNRIPRHRVDEVIELVGLGAAAHRRAGGFSLGMGQRLGIAAALLGDPSVLLFDEPVNGLDPDGIVWARSLLRSLAEEGRTVFVSSHLMSEVALTADDLIVIGRGRLVASSTASELISRSAHVYVRVRSPRRDELAAALVAAGARVKVAEDTALEVTGLDCEAVGDIAARNGLTVHELVLHEPSLEAAYMELAHGSVDYRATSSPHGALATGA
jgi:ABC-2 type transport system ATP-binding protein